MNALIKRPTGEIGLTAEFTAQAEAAIAASALIGIVDTPEKQEEAVMALFTHKGLLELAETSRVEFKAPYLRVCKLIDKTVKDGIEKNEEEFQRLKGLVDAFWTAETAAGRIPPKVEGQTIKQEWRWEVTNIFDLFHTYPGCVDPQPRKREINETIAKLATVGEPKMPGLRIWREVSSGVRLQRDGKLIEI